ncbi:MAG: GIY-YIG nuclease family protein [Phormidesmis sp.]
MTKTGIHSWSLYLVRTRQDTLYAGISTDVAKRFAEHEKGKRGAKYLRARGPLQMVYTVEVGSHVLAAKVEYRFKKLTKEKKESVVAQAMPLGKLLRLLKLEEEALLLRNGCDAPVELEVEPEVPNSAEADGNQVSEIG